eukprot:scaffold7337_cov131-Cylindrotheca_fusiformis.AAC.2
MSRLRFVLLLLISLLSAASEARNLQNSGKGKGKEKNKAPKSNSAIGKGKAKGKLKAPKSKSVNDPKIGLKLSKKTKAPSSTKGTKLSTKSPDSVKGGKGKGGIKKSSTSSKSTKLSSKGKGKGGKGKGGSPPKLPTATPSESPTATPSENPTAFPTPTPSENPTAFPTPTPSTTPSMLPSGLPSATPSMLPSLSPSKSPTGLPSHDLNEGDTVPSPYKGLIWTNWKASDQVLCCPVGAVPTATTAFVEIARCDVFSLESIDIGVPAANLPVTVTINGYDLDGNLIATTDLDLALGYVRYNLPTFVDVSRLEFIVPSGADSISTEDWIFV